MKGDFSRLTFDKAKHYSSVRMQQGRVQLDADWNEQQDITAHRIETEITDFIGQSGAPEDPKDKHNVSTSFSISVEQNTIKIGAGRYYVEGMLFENETQVDFNKQPDYPNAPLPTEDGIYLAYLDVWQRHITALEDPNIREAALGGADTTTRIKNVWQVKLHKVGETGTSVDETFLKKFRPPSWKPDWESAISSGKMAARTNKQNGTIQENQLYRVEIHQGGNFAEVEELDGTTITIKNAPSNAQTLFTVGQLIEYNPPTDQGMYLATVISVAGTKLTVKWQEETPPKQEKSSIVGQGKSSIVGPIVTFKWARDNGAIAARVEAIEKTTITVNNAGRNIQTEFPEHTLIEYCDEAIALTGQPGYLAKVQSVQNQTLTLKAVQKTETQPEDQQKKQQKEQEEKEEQSKLENNLKSLKNIGIVRRWDCPDEISINRPTTDEWIPLEKGIKVKFDRTENVSYKTGDYWLIPARDLSGDTERSSDSSPINQPPSKKKNEKEQQSNPKQEYVFLPPHGILHRYCSLAVLERKGGNFLSSPTDCRVIFKPITSGLVSKAGDTMTGELIVENNMIVRQMLAISDQDISSSADNKKMELHITYSADEKKKKSEIILGADQNNNPHIQIDGGNQIGSIDLNGISLQWKRSENNHIIEIEKKEGNSEHNLEVYIKGDLKVRGELIIEKPLSCSGTSKLDAHLQCQLKLTDLFGKIPKDSDITVHLTAKGKTAYSLSYTVDVDNRLILVYGQEKEAEFSWEVKCKIKEKGKKEEKSI